MIEIAVYATGQLPDIALVKKCEEWPVDYSQEQTLQTRLLLAAQQLSTN
jgi:hypothetical protein